MRRAALATFALLAAAGLCAAGLRPVGEFSALAPGDPLPAAWQLTSVSGIERHTRYSLVRLDGRTVVRAEAQASMASLLRRVEIDPATHPWLRWHWRVDELVAGGSLRSRDTDDFAARLYVMFDADLRSLPFLERTKLRIARALYGDELPLAALCYVWSTDDPAGARAWSAYTDRVQLIVVASGQHRLGEWTAFERNVADDYRAAFGGTPPRISAIAIASDSDNTGGRALAYFGDISFAGQRVDAPR